MGNSRSCYNGNSFIFLPYYLMGFSALRAKRGFTLIELLLVIGIIAILASIVIVAINPTKQLGDARNAQRRADVNTILNAVYQYAIDNQGTLPGTSGNTIDSNNRMICTGNNLTCSVVANTAVNLWALTGSYIVKLPVDPSEPSFSAGTAYYITKAGNGRVTVTAPRAEQNVTISVSR